MASLILPDSNIYIGATRAGLDPFQELGAHSDEYEFATCGMVVLEVTRGLRFPKILQSFRDRFAVMIYVPTTNQIWERAAQLAWSLDRHGHTIQAQDIVIAACALQTGATMLTHDAHFSFIPGLNVVSQLS